jgi:Ca-activated chloride channel family protein
VAQRRLRDESGGEEVVKHLAPAVALVSALALPCAAQDSPAPPDKPQSPVFRTGASLVSINVTVSDGKRLVSDLRPDDFAVYEDGVQQRVEFFESKNVPIDLILLIDTSSSMREKMPVVREAAMGFLKTLREGDRGAVVAFNDGVNVLQGLTTDRETLFSAVKNVESRGGTALNNALYVAVKQFGQKARQTGDVRRQAIAVLSDGEDTTSVISFDDVLALARKSGVNIYTIALRSEYAAERRLAENGRKYFSPADYAMKQLAQETGAQCFFPDTAQDLKGVYASIADELATQYSIGYTPSNSRPDGRFRRIVVRMTTHPEMQPRTRAGYTADAVSAAGLVRQP